MEGSFAEELYSSVDKLQLSNVESIPSSIANISDYDGNDLGNEDGSLWDSSDNELDKASDLDREWQRRHNQFHTIGYRDGLIAGKEASAQEGFNIGFKQSVLVGYDWGLARGVTSALACLPDGMKEKLVETQEKRDKFQYLYDSLHSLSTTDALKLFRDDILANKSVEQSENAEASSHVVGLRDRNSDSGLLGKYYGELQSLLRESPAIKVHFAMDR